MWKGKYSERLVHKKMLQLSDEYTIFNNLLFESNGRSTQIDHIVVSPYGVFVIETKGYKGWILGGENSEYWTQVICKSKHKFYNPIKQNEGHVRFLRHLFKCPVDFPFIPIVVFNNSAELKVHVNNHRAKNLIRLGVCPQCGGQLVLRKGRYGSFYGCSNFPKCKFTLN